MGAQESRRLLEFETHSFEVLSQDTAKEEHVWGCGSWSILGETVCPRLPMLPSRLPTTPWVRVASATHSCIYRGTTGALYATTERDG